MRGQARSIQQKTHLSTFLVAAVLLIAGCGGGDSGGDVIGHDTGAPPDITSVKCARLVPLRGWETDPSAVAVLFAVEDCKTNLPIRGLTRDQFEILEDNSALSSEAHRDVLPSRGQLVYIDLLLDMSDSTIPIRAQLVSSAKSFGCGSFGTAVT